jgi:hypothetical protein
MAFKQHSAEVEYKTLFIMVEVLVMLEKQPWATPIMFPPPIFARKASIS